MATVLHDPTKALVEPENHNNAKLKFARGDGFQKVLKARVDEYFKANSISPRDNTRMYIKTAVILAWISGSYALLVFGGLPLWASLLLAVSLGLACAAGGFNIQHDGGHRGYSNNKVVNKVMASTLDLLGGSSWVWNVKHNHMHHIYANIEGYDDDVNVGLLGRLDPHQPRLWVHRFQHIYLWFLYGFLTIKWQVLDDFVNIGLGRLGSHKLPRPKGIDLFIFLGGKVFFFTFALVIPMYFHPVLTVLGFYFIISMIQGIVMAVVFQCAHCLEEAAFPLPDADNRIDDEWAVHQLRTTVDFARKDPILCWYLGGLNLQAVHHLFPQICHIHYPQISDIIEKTCAEYGFPYMSHKTFRAAIRSHYRLLRKLGRGEEAASV